MVAAKPRCKPVTCMWLQQTCAHKSVLKACPAAHLHAKSVECMWLHAIPWICFHGSHYAETNESKTTNKSIALSLRETVSKAQLWILMAMFHNFPKLYTLFTLQNFDQMRMIFHDASPGEIIACEIGQPKVKQTHHKTS